MLRETQCPECGSSWDGGSMIETFIKQREEGYKVWAGMSDADIEAYVKESYSEPYRWGRQIGITDMGTDRTEFVACPDCKAMFERFGGKKIDRKFEYPSKNNTDERTL